MAGMFGHGDAFVLRDPNGIRPAFYYADDEVVVVASERPVIQTAFNVPIESVHEIPRGNALIIKKDGQYDLHEINAPLEKWLEPVEVPSLISATPNCLSASCIPKSFAIAGIF